MVLSEQVESFGFENQLDLCFEESAKSGLNVCELCRSLCEPPAKLPPIDSPEGRLVTQNNAVAGGY
jgi:hypothetical protein